MDTVYLDIETTGLCPEQDKIVDIALIYDDGDILFESLVNPSQKIPKNITAINGVRDDDVAYAPLLEEVIEELEEVCEGKHLVIYNAAFDMSFLPSLQPANISCAMHAFAEFFNKGGEKSWHRLIVAAHALDYDWGDDVGHRALAHARACRHVWRALPEASRIHAKLPLGFPEL
ncbi:MAG: 3'-5' exonuclease [Pseudobacteriovorax sp.]|nr:3'-5' exonuclease [Pseudobacteriovorax sp.]